LASISGRCDGLLATKRIMKELTKLEELIIKYGSEMSTHDFIKRFKKYEPTYTKIYQTLAKHNLPTYTQAKKEQRTFEEEVIERAREKIAENRLKTIKD